MPDVITAVSMTRSYDRSTPNLWVTITDADGGTQVLEMLNPNPIEKAYNILGTTKLVVDVLEKSDLGKVRVTYSSEGEEFVFWCESVEPIDEVDLKEHFTSRYSPVEKEQLKR